MWVETEEGLLNVSHFWRLRVAQSPHSRRWRVLGSWLGPEGTTIKEVLLVLFDDEADAREWAHNVATATGGVGA